MHRENFRRLPGLLAPLLLSACGGSGGTRVEEGNRTGVLHVGNAAEPQGLDPHIVSGVPEHYIITSLFEGLVIKNPVTLEIEPAVAQSWEVSDDGLTYTFHLRDNARWSNGDPLTAEDFRWSWERALTPELGSQYNYMYFPIANAEAFAKAQTGAGSALPSGGKAFISVRDFDKGGIALVAKELASLGFSMVATRGTAKVLDEAGVQVEIVNKVGEGRPHIVDMIKNGEIQLIVNTTEGKKATKDSASIRRNAENHHVYYTTTLAAAQAVCMALRFGNQHSVRRLQELHERVGK